MAVPSSIKVSVLAGFINIGSSGIPDTSSDSLMSNPEALAIEDSLVIQSHPAVPKPLSPTDVLELTVHSAVCSSNLDNFLKYNNLPLLFNLFFSTISSELFISTLRDLFSLALISFSIKEA